MSDDVVVRENDDVEASGIESEADLDAEVETQQGEDEYRYENGYEVEGEFEDEDDWDEWREPPDSRETTRAGTREGSRKRIAIKTTSFRRELEHTLDEDDEERGTARERKKSIYELGSFAAIHSNADFFQSRRSLANLLPEEEDEEQPEEEKRPQISLSLGIPGIARINLSPLTQKILGCVIGENVTTEYPWIYVNKEIIEDNIDLHDESSDLLPVKDEIHFFPDTKILVGYAPSSSEEGQFYVCISEMGRDAVIESIERLRAQQESRVRNAVYKAIGHWQELGSSREVGEAIVENTRPLFQIEVESTVDLLNVPLNLTDRSAAEQRDGYVELLPYRQTMQNVLRILVSIAIQSTPTRRHSEAQTDPSMPNNMWSQYEYVYKAIDPNKYSADERDVLRRFLDKYTDDVCDVVRINATWDIYTNDYSNLVRSERDTLPPVAVRYTEHQSYSDGKLCTEKVINDLSWHPLWTGIAAVAYTDHCKSENLVGFNPPDEVMRACYENNHVLVWSFTDCLSPKLVLESPRRVTTVSFCPQDGGVVVGGCENGQIAIWTIPGMIESVEAVVVHTSAQVKYKIAMQSLMKWMRDTSGTSFVRPAAMSSLEYSQKGAITEIAWVPAFNKVDKNGRISSLSDDDSYTADDLSWQFLTSSKDGTIAFYDLKWRPPSDNDTTQPATKKKRKTVPRPDALVQSISPFKVLDRIFKPDYQLVVQHPDEARIMSLTTIDLHYPEFRKKRVFAGLIRSYRDDIAVRRYYKAIVEKPSYEMKPLILVGTMDGDCGRVTWDGYEFTTGVVLNKENCKWICRSRIHDGPVTHSARSKYLNDIVLTVGGRIFALWRDDADEPVFWKRNSEYRYTACSWGTCRPTVVLLGRSDGTIEIWDFLVKSHGPIFTQSVSGSIITGIYTHKLHLNPECVGFCDYNGTLRVFCAPRIMLTYEEKDIDWMRSFVDREVERKQEFKAWQRQWSDSNLENIERKRQLAELEAERKRVEAEEKIKKETAEAMAKIAAAKATAVVRKPGQFLEEAREHWKSMELKRMQRVILEKKGLMKEVLEKQRAPVMKLTQEARRKKRKLREILRLQDKIFEDTVAFLFPEQHQERKPMELPNLSVKGGGKEEDDIGPLIDKDKRQRRFASHEEELIFDFLETQAESLASIKAHPYQHSFVWRKVLSDGKARRNAMDLELREHSAHRWRYARTKGRSVAAPSVVFKLTPRVNDEIGKEEQQEDEKEEEDATAR